MKTSNDGAANKPVTMTTQPAIKHLSILLTKDVKPGILGWLIRKFTGDGPTHAAIWFVANHATFILEATDKGIVANRWNETFSKENMVIAIEATTLDATKAETEAIKHLGHPYAFRELFNFVTGNGKIDDEGEFCSAYVTLVYQAGDCTTSFKEANRTSPNDILRYVLTHGTDFKITETHNVKDIYAFAGLRS